MNRATAILVLVAAIAFAVSPLVSGGFGGFDPNQYPVPQVDPPVQPAGWAFSIWGVIYLWLLASAAFGLLRRADAADWAPHRWPLFASLAVGASWIPVAQVSPVWATVLIWVMLAGAAAAFITSPRRDRWLATAPLGLFAGWLAAASSVSLGLLAAGYGLLQPVPSATAAIVLALLLSVALLKLRAEPSFAAGVAWALVGIAASDAAEAPGVTALASAGAAVVAGLAFGRRRRRP